MGEYKISPWEELTIQDDYMFKRVMRRKRLCKPQEAERVSYMTFEMKMKEIHKEGRAEGRKENLLENVRALMHNLHLSAEEAMNALSVPQNEREKLAPML